MQEKKRSTVPVLEKASEALDLNQTASLRLVNEGHSLVHEVEEKGMDEEGAARLTDYLARCLLGKAQMNARRKPFTTALTLLQKRFVAEENALDPAQEGSPAAAAKRLLQAWQQAKLDAAQEAERRLLRNRDAFCRRLARRDDLTGEQQEAALVRARRRLEEGQKALKADATRTHYLPVVTSGEGYLELFKFWWEEVGKGLPQADLERYLHPMLSFARKQARKGIFITADGLTYKEVPSM